MRAGRDEDRRHRHDLDDRKRCRHRQVEELDGLAVDLGLECRKARSANHEDDAERGEREEEHDGGRGRDRRPQCRQRDVEERAHATSAEHAGCLLLVRVEVSPQAADGADDDCVVEEHVCDENATERLVEPEEPQGSTVTEQRDERRAHHHGGEHERHRDAARHERLPGIVAGEHGRAGEGDRDGEDRRQRSLPEREPRDFAERAVGDHLTQRGQVEHALGNDAPTEDDDERVREEHSEKGQRNEGERASSRGRAGSAHRNTTDVHSSIHSSRCRSIVAA